MSHSHLKQIILLIQQSAETRDIRFYKTNERTICENTSLLSARNSFSNVLGIVLAICQFLFPGPNIIILAVTASNGDDFAKKLKLQLKRVKGFFGTKITENMIVLLAPQSAVVDMKSIDKTQKFQKIIKDVQNCIIFDTDEKTEIMKSKLTNAIHALIDTNYLGGNRWCGSLSFLMINKLIVSAVNDFSKKVRYFFGQSGKKGVLSKHPSDLHTGDKDLLSNHGYIKEHFTTTAENQAIVNGEKPTDNKEEQPESMIRTYNKKAEGKLPPDSTEASKSNIKQNNGPNKRQICTQTLDRGLINSVNNVNLRPQISEMKETQNTCGIRNCKQQDTIPTMAVNDPKSISANVTIETREIGTCTDNFDVQYDRQYLTGVTKPKCPSSMYLKRQPSTNSSKSTANNKTYKIFKSQRVFETKGQKIRQ